jgi:hypothetical protein
MDLGRIDMSQFTGYRQGLPVAITARSMLEWVYNSILQQLLDITVRNYADDVE